MVNGQEITRRIEASSIREGPILGGKKNWSWGGSVSVRGEEGAAGGGGEITLPISIESV